MIVCVIASSPVAAGSNLLFHRSRVSFPTKFSSPLPSTKLLSLCSYEKDLVCGFRATEPHVVCSVLVHPEIKKAHEAIAVESGYYHPIDVGISTKGKSGKARPCKKWKNPAKLSSEASHCIKIDDARPVIRYPLATESAIKSIIGNNTLVFVVDGFCSKNTIKDFVMTMFKVRARKVNTLIMHDGTKKAFVKLAPEYNAMDVAKEIQIL